LPLLLHIKGQIDFYVCKRGRCRTIFAAPLAHQPPAAGVGASETRNPKPEIEIGT
jgi:hypothetical protein